MNYPVVGFKQIECLRILTDLTIPVGQSIAIGDSPADKGLLLHAGVSVAINPVGGIEQVADHVIHDDLRPVISLLEGLDGVSLSSPQPATDSAVGRHDHG
jgi:phosphoserine phosphatase